MDDTISRQAAIDAVGFYSLHSGDKLLFADKPLKELPPAQPEIVRCKECVYHAGWNYCEEVDGLWYDDDYCCHGEKGERREE